MCVIILYLMRVITAVVVSTLIITAGCVNVGPQERDPKETHSQSKSNNTIQAPNPTKPDNLSLDSAKAFAIECEKARIIEKYREEAKEININTHVRTANEHSTGFVVSLEVEASYVREGDGTIKQTGDILLDPLYFVNQSSTIRAENTPPSSPPIEGESIDC